MTGSTVRTRDGRALRYEEHGDLSGKPVILMHGTPGSRLGPIPRASRLYPLGVRVIAYDRPGYGGSDHLPERFVAHAAADVADLADTLGIERFAVVGRSGGGPHALACAALLSERVVRAAALVSVAPRDLMGESWFEDMNEHNADRYRMAERGLEEYAAYVRDSMNRSRQDPDTFVPYAELPKADKVVISDYGIKTMMFDNFAEGLRTSIDGWIDDNLAFVEPWGFDPSAIAVPVWLWHGTEDGYSPVEHSRWLAKAISGSELVLGHGRAHLGALVELRRALRWAAAGLG